MSTASRIDRVELHEFTYRAEGFGRDAHGALCCEPGGVQAISAFCLVIRTADGLRGEYCPMHSGKNPAIAAQVAALAPRLIGKDAFGREGIWHALRWAQRHLGAVGLSAGRAKIARQTASRVTWGATVSWRSDAGWPAGVAIQGVRPAARTPPPSARVKRKDRCINAL